MNRYPRVFLAFLLLMPAGLLADPPGVFALVGGRVHTVGSAPIENGTVIIRDGLIERVGAGIAVPADAVVIEVEGLNVYPGLFDAQTTLGLQTSTRRGGDGADTSSQSSTEPTARNRASQQLRLSAETLDGKRSTGVTTVLIAPTAGNFNGQSVILNLGDGELSTLILKDPASAQISFNTKSWGTFPDSLMGAIYLARQTLLDAQWLATAKGIYERDPRGRKRPEATADLEALAPVLRREIPVVFMAHDQVRMLRAADIGKEFGLRWVVSGALEAWEHADLLKERDATVLFSVDFPKKPSINVEDQSLAQIRDRVLSPTGASELARRNVPFALVSGPSLSSGGFIDGIRKVINAGLSEDDALRAVTLAPARIFGVDRQIGTLEAGKIANVFVTEGKFWEKDAEVRQLFIDGRQIRLTPESVDEESDESAPGEGSWDLTIRTPDGEISMHVALTITSGRIGGSFSGDRGSGQIRDGSIDGNRLSFTLSAQTVPGGETSDWRFSGTVEGNSIEGEVSNSLGTFQFTGRKPE